MKSTDPIDLLLDTSDDITLSVADGLQFSAGQAAIAQGIRTRIQSIKGEMFSDLESGIDIYGIVGKKFNEPRIRKAFRDAILGAPGVDVLKTLTIAFDQTTRVASIYWEVIGKLDDTVISGTLPVSV